MKIRITSINCDDLPSHYFLDSCYEQGKLLENFRVGEEYDVYGVSFSNVHHYFIRLELDSLYLCAYPAALTDVIDETMPISWVVSHETKLLHPKLPSHQVIFCPKEWLVPFFSMFVDRLDEGEEKEKMIFLESARRDYPTK